VCTSMGRSISKALSGVKRRQNKNLVTSIDPSRELWSIRQVETPGPDMKNILCFIVKILLLFFMMSAGICCGPPNRATLKEELLAVENTPEWVLKGSGRFQDDENKWHYCGVGMVSGIRNRALARTTAENRARHEMAKVLQTARLTPDQSEKWNQFVDRWTNTMDINDHWVSPDGSFYALARVPELKLMAIASNALGSSLMAIVSNVLGSSQASSKNEASNRRIRPQELAEIRKEAENEKNLDPARTEIAKKPESAENQAKPTLRPSQSPIVAVFDIEIQRLTFEREFLNGLTDYLAIRLAESGKYQVIPRSALKERLAESKMTSYKECYDQSCQIELGRELAAEKTLATQIVKLGSRCSVSIALYDLKKAATETAATTSGACDEDGLAGSLDAVVDKMIKR
jgi:hypothetical protein